MALVSETKLGESTNVVGGYSADIYSVPFTNSSKPALFENEAVIKDPDDGAKWSNPVITLHENVEDLLSAILRVKLRPMRYEDLQSEGGTPSSWPSGALMLAGLDETARQEAIKNLSTQLGIELSTEGWSYALIRCTRNVGTATHLCYQRGVFGNPDPDNTIRPDALEALKKLEKLDKTSTDVSLDGAKGYFNFYETYGSHFVSSIVAGDSIFQVFAYGAKAFQEIKQASIDYPESFSGVLSFTFIIYTVPRSEDGIFGYAEAAGSICIASKDEKMEESLKGDLWSDESYSGTNSVLAPYYNNRANEVNETFKKVVPITFELSSLSIFAEYYRMLIWHRVFKGVMYTKYMNGSGVAPYFSNNCPYDLDAIFKNSNPMGGDSFLSMLCTPSVNIMQETIDLSTIVIKFSEMVKKFSIFADAIQTPNVGEKNTSINVPGSTNVTLFGHVISLPGNSRLPPNIQISASAFQEIEGRLCCGEFYGGLRVSDADSGMSYVIVNGLMMKYSDGKVTIFRDVREPPSSTIVTERLADIQFALVVAEARLNFLLGNPANNEKGIELMKRYLLWLAGVAGNHEQLVALKARATYLAKVAASPQGAGIPVPLLRYEAYKDVVNNVQNVLNTATASLTNFQNQIRERLAEEREIDREEALNENIVKSGKLLYEYIKSQAEYQEDLESIFKSVLEDKEQEMNSVVEESKKLKSRLEEQRNVVESAVIDYQDAVVDWMNDQKLKAALDIASGLFALGFAFVTPSTSFDALASLGATVQRIQKFVTVFDAVINVYQSFEELPDNPQSVIDALEDVQQQGLGILTALEYDELLVNHNAVISTGPDIPEKTTLSAAFEILVLRGKALLESQKAIQKIAADLSAVQQRIRLHQDQKKRLEELKIELDAKPEELDVEKIDLIGLSSQLLFFQRQMLMTLASTVVIQDRALQYEYLRKPTPIGSFTMLGLQLAILRQSQNINQGLTVQPLPEHQKYPIVYEIHGVRPETITKGRRFQFNIEINKREFAPFNYVRVESVVVEVDGIVSTDSGKYYTELVFHGQPFYDRGFNRETLTFQTTSRIFTGLQNVVSSSQDHESKVAEDPQAHEFTTGRDAFDDKISNITPFSMWHFSLPNSISNEGIKFGDRVNVRLIFRIYAQLKETESSPLEIYKKSLQYLARSPPVVAASPSSTDTADPVTKADVLKTMSGKSICQGWDVIFSMSNAEVNAQLKAQFDDRQGNPNFMREIPEMKDEGTINGTPYKKSFAFKFNAPEIQFRLNNTSMADVWWPIVSGFYKHSMFIENHWKPIIDLEIDEGLGASVLGGVALGILAGSVSSQKNVAVTLKGGLFAPINIGISGLAPIIATDLTDYFAGLEEGTEVYNFGTLDLAGISIVPSLKPTNFIFNVYHTPSDRDLLQLFIATTGEMQSAAECSLEEPIPSGYGCSLIVNTKIFYSSVLPASIGHSQLLRLKSVPPEDDDNKDKVWSAEVIKGGVLCTFPKRQVDEGFGQFEGAMVNIKSYIKVEGDMLTVDLEGMTFKYDEEESIWDVKMAYDSNNYYQFQYGLELYDVYSGVMVSSKYKNYSLPATLSWVTTMPMKVTGSGQNQMVEIDVAPTDITLDGHLSPPAGPCETNDRELQEMLMKEMKEQIPPRLMVMFNQTFTSVSLFAIKNLLFPSENTFDLKEAFVPGDMVVFGHVIEPTSKK